MKNQTNSPHPSIHPIVGRAGCIYLAGADDTYLLVDTGFPSTAKKLFSYLRDELHTGHDAVRTVVLTHSHFDHTSGVDIIVGESGAHLAAHMNAEPYLTGSRAMPRTNFMTYMKFFTFLVTNGFPRPKLSELSAMPWSGIPGLRRGVRSRVNVWLDDGDTVPGFPEWTVIHTPGHTDDGICLYNAELKTMFSGDTVINYKGHVVLNPLLTQDAGALKASLKKLQKYEVDYLCPGWGMPVKGSNLLAGIIGN